MKFGTPSSSKRQLSKEKEEEAFQKHVSLEKAYEKKRGDEAYERHVSREKAYEMQRMEERERQKMKWIDKNYPTFSDRMRYIEESKHD